MAKTSRSEGRDAATATTVLAAAIEALEVLRMAAADGAEIDREARRHQCFSCRPIRRWRTCEVSVSITDTVMTISTRMADTSE